MTDFKSIIANVNFPEAYFHLLDTYNDKDKRGRTAALASQSAGWPHHICCAVHCVSGNASKTEVAPFLQDILVFRRQDEQRGKCP